MCVLFSDNKYISISISSSIKTADIMNSCFIGSKSKFSEPGTTPSYTYKDGGVLFLPDFFKIFIELFKTERRGCVYVRLFEFLHALGSFSNHTTFKS